MSLLGKTAPDFNLHHTKTDKVALSDFAGESVVIAFFPAAFTGVCEKELCTFRNSLADLNGLGAKVVAISVDGPFSNGAFATKNELNFPVLSDYNREATNAYGIPVENFAGLQGYTSSNRAVFIVDGSGSVSYEWIAPNLGTEPDYDAIKAHLS